MEISTVNEMSTVRSKLMKISLQMTKKVMMVLAEIVIGAPTIYASLRTSLIFLMHSTQQWTSQSGMAFIQTLSSSE
jgi:hypothetical protein